MKKTLILGCAVLATALLAGCGSSSKTNSSETSPSANTAASKTPSRYGAGGGGATTSTTAAASNAVVVTAKHSNDGTILAAGPKHMTVYLFEKDTGGQSACSGACAQNWPPLTTSGTPQASGAAQSSQLGTITRTDGTKQVTYNGHPLYFFVKDGDAGDAYGQGVKAFGAEWYVLSPSGAKVEENHGSGDSHGNAS